MFSLVQVDSSPNGHEELQAALHPAGGSLDDADGGHLGLLQWARQANPPCPWDGLTCSKAARGGHLAVLQWARTVADPPCPWDDATCWWAVTNGHLDVVRWLRLQADPPCWWNAHTEARAKAKWPGVF
jgi:hypothetical protein